MSKLKLTTVNTSRELEAAIGFAPENFGYEAFEESSSYGWAERGPMPRDPGAWDTIVPRGAPAVGKQLADVIEKLVKSTWKFAEPRANAGRGKILMGARGQTAPGLGLSAKYSPQVRPTESVITTTFPPDAGVIASDWGEFVRIERTNAVTFRGDTRHPNEVIVRAGGFSPPALRTDRYYLENNIYHEFASYLLRRYSRTLTLGQFLRAVDSAAPMPQEQRLLVDYMMWRKITEREAVHLGRMVENECLKGYISTSRSIDTAIFFATKKWTQEGWLYVTVVHDAFVVPHKHTTVWGSQEAEIAQWGPVPSERIVGFRRVRSDQPTSPIFIKRKFRMMEPHAFEQVFNVMSGERP